MCSNIIGGFVFKRKIEGKFLFLFTIIFDHQKIDPMAPSLISNQSYLLPLVHIGRITRLIMLRIPDPTSSIQNIIGNPDDIIN